MHACIVWIHSYHMVCVEVKEQLVRLNSLLLPYGSQRPNSVCQALRHMPSWTESSLWVCNFYLVSSGNVKKLEIVTLKNKVYNYQTEHPPGNCYITNYQSNVSCLFFYFILFCDSAMPEYLRSRLKWIDIAHAMTGLTPKLLNCNNYQIAQKGHKIKQ